MWRVLPPAQPCLSSDRHSEGVNQDKTAWERGQKQWRGLTPSCTPGTPGYTVQYDALLYLLSFSCIYNDVHRSLNGAKRTVFPLLGSLLRTKTKFLMSPSLYVWSLAPLQQLVCQRSSTNSKRIITNFVGNAEYAISNAECSHGNIFASYWID